MTNAIHGIKLYLKRRSYKKARKSIKEDIMIQKMFNQRKKSDLAEGFDLPLMKVENLAKMERQMYLKMALRGKIKVSELAITTRMLEI